MKITAIVSGLAVSSVLLLGCDNSREEAPALPGPVDTEAPPAAPDKEMEMEKATGSMMDDMQGKAGEANDRMGAIADDGKAKLGAMADGMGEKMPEMPANSSEVDVDSIDMSSGAELSESQAEAVIQKVKGLISAQNLDTAEQWIGKLDNVTLPAGFDQYVQQLKSMLASAKGGVGSVGEMLGK